MNRKNLSNLTNFIDVYYYAVNAIKSFRDRMVSFLM